MAINVLTITALSVIFLIAIRFVYLIFPVRVMTSGTKVYIYLDGKLNREANISCNLKNDIVIYDKVALPVHYRGRFYCVGYLNDGGKIMYLKCKKHYVLAYFSELIRKVANFPEYDDPTVQSSVSNSESSKLQGLDDKEDKEELYDER